MGLSMYVNYTSKEVFGEKKKSLHQTPIKITVISCNGQHIRIFWDLLKISKPRPTPQTN